MNDGDQQRVSSAVGGDVGELARCGLEWVRRQRNRARTLEPLAGDVSARSYFRVRGQGLILAHYPPELRRSYDCFLATDRLLRIAGVGTPAIKAIDPERRWMLTADVGDRSVFTLEDEELARRSMTAAVELVRRIAHLSRKKVSPLSPALEGELLSREIRKTSSLYFRDALDDRSRRRLQEVMYESCARLGSSPLVPAHRDFMARNLMLPEAAGGSPELAVLDHQDLRLAPRGYDLASLFHDSCPLGREGAERFLTDLIEKEGPHSPMGDREAVDRCAFQRCLKIVGTFVGFAQRGRRRYLPMVAGALSTAARKLEGLPEATDDAVAALRRCAESAGEALDREGREG